MLTALLPTPLQTMLPKAITPSLTQTSSTFITPQPKVDSFERILATQPIVASSSLRSGDRYYTQLSPTWLKTESYQKALTVGLENHTKILAGIINTAWKGLEPTSSQSKVFGLFLGALSDTVPKERVVSLVDNAFSTRKDSQVSLFLKQNLQKYINTELQELMPSFWVQLGTYREQNFRQLKSPSIFLQEKEKEQLVRIAFEKGFLYQLAKELELFKPPVGRHNPLGLEVCHTYAKAMKQPLGFLIGTHEAAKLNPAVLDEMIGSGGNIPRPELTTREKRSSNLGEALRDSKLFEIIDMLSERTIDNQKPVLRVASYDIPADAFDPMMFVCMYKNYFEGSKS